MTEDAAPSPSDKKAASPLEENSTSPSQESAAPEQPTPNNTSDSTSDSISDNASNTDVNVDAEPQATIKTIVQSEVEPTKAPELTTNRMAEPALERWQLVWDVVIFQGKLVLDGGRDLLLSPLSIIIAIYALITGSQAPGRQFYDLMHLGHRTDKWINLFGAAKRIPPSEFSAKFLNSFGDEGADDQNVDNLVSQMEELVKKRYEKGGVTATAKTNIDKAFDKLHAKIHPRDKQP